MKYVRFVFLTLILLAFTGCAEESEEMGIVARVNGSPIFLSQLEFQHDLAQMEYGVSGVPSVDKLRSEYGQILSDLIVQELIVQELARLDLSVTDEELKAAEDQVRKDYPEGAFEQVLIEEYIDLKSWRKQLSYYLAVKKFYSQVLRPKSKIDYKEAEDYYKRHISEYYLPASSKFLVIRGPNKDLVQKAVSRFMEDQDARALSVEFGEVTARDLIVRDERLPKTWAKALTGVGLNQATPIMSGQFGFEALVLLERNPAKVLSPTQAYPLVEEALLDEKLHDAFSGWLEEAMSKANIEVSEHLLPKSEDSDAPIMDENASS